MSTAAKYLSNIPLAEYTTYKIGGPAQHLYIPQSFDELKNAALHLKESRQHYHIIGGGSNLLIADRGLEQPVILMAECCRDLVQMENILESGAGTKLADLVEYSIEHSLAGLQALSGIPGTVGGAVIMNAGAYGSEISHCLSEVIVIDEMGAVKEIPHPEVRFAYRSSPGLTGKLILRARFRLRKGKKAELKQKAQEIIGLRKAKQPYDLPSAGSVFKKHPLGPAGLLIEQAGLKAFRIGDAQISPKHANFIVNLGKARAIEVLALIRHIQKVIIQKFAVELELEQRLLGFKQEELLNPEKFL